MKFNHRPFLFAFSVLIFLGLNCKNKETNSNNNETVYFNGKIYTVNPNQVWAEAILVKDGVIKFVGTDSEAKAVATGDAEEIDLEGAFLMPGIHDVHLHPLEASTNNFQFIVDDSIEDPEEFAGIAEDAILSNPGSGWLLGWGHWIDVPLAATRPPKEILDEVATDRPIAIMEQTSHSIWCNSKALELMGINATTPDPIGGIIMRSTNGEPNGILIDNAGNLLLDLALAPTPERAQNDYDGLINFGLPELAKYGITSICDARTYWKRNHHDVWKRLENENKLTVRVNLGLWAYPSEEDISQINMLKSLYSKNENSLLQINQIKLYCDGIIHNTTSAMQSDYLIDYFELPTNNGLNYFSQQRISTYISELESTGFDFHIHAIGNRGVHESLNAVEQSGTENGRHRITHVEYIDPSDYSRFLQLNVTADAQVSGEFTHPNHWHDNDYLIGASLNNNNIPLKNLSDAGARITLSSDWDVSDLNPFIGLENAVSRSPENLSLEEAIKGYTINAAYVMRQENKVGSLEIGKDADFIILDRNIFEIPNSEISAAKVLETYLKGECVFK